MKKPQLKIKKVHYIILILLSYIIPINISNTSALDYQSTTDVQFTFTPTLNLSVSGDLIIDELSPGTSADSNVINVSVSTNSFTGYNLSATVGSSTNATTNLTHSTSNTNFFTGLSTSNSCIALDATCDNEHANIWGYSYSNDNGSTWSNYSGLPLYTNAGTVLNYKNNASANVVKFKIAALASNVQASGAYSNTINFTAVANPETHYYIQDFTLSQCEQLATNDHFTVYDRRDENDYTVRYINGQCWMTQNLYYNFNTTPISGGCPTRERGCYYTWENALDSCPANWTLPAKTDFESLISIYNTNEKLAAAPFSGVYGGYFNTYSSSFQLMGTYILYWSSNNQVDKYAWGLCSSNELTYIESTVKYFPRPIRCVRSS